MSWLLDLWRGCFGTPEVVETAPLVTVVVDGVEHQVTPGPGFARRLYQEIGGLSGQFLCWEGGFLGDSDRIDLKGGEVFVTVPYR